MMAAFQSGQEASAVAAEVRRATATITSDVEFAESEWSALV
jgi:hypothetical protein